jgi:hypothetical protein
MSSVQPIEVAIVVTDPIERTFNTERKLRSIVSTSVTEWIWPDDFTSGDIREGEHTAQFFVSPLSVRAADHSTSRACPRRSHRVQRPRSDVANAVVGLVTGRTRKRSCGVIESRPHEISASERDGYIALPLARAVCDVRVGPVEAEPWESDDVLALVSVQRIGKRA